MSIDIVDRLKASVAQLEEMIESLRASNATLSAGYEAMSETARKRNAEVAELREILDRAGLSP